MWFASIKKHSTRIGGGLVVALLLVWSVGTDHAAYAQGSLSLTVTPPLYQLSAQPGERFSSSITVVNSNNFPLSLYIEPVIFTPRGERGQGALQRLEDGQEHQLASWITVAESAVTLAPGASRAIQFIIQVPDDASPGGHYAALLVGTQPPARDAETSAISVSSSIASLVFLRVAGEVIEQGLIREFSTEQTLYQRPEAQFTMRFQNTGNVHVQPTGMITIYNMWGAERGRVPITQQNEFGNVLPGSVRAFSFTWRTDENVFDFGRYRAVATLTYGTESRKNEHREVYFWVVPFVALLQVIGGAVVLIGLLIFMVRRYVRYALAIEAERIRGLAAEQVQAGTPDIVPPSSLVKTLVRPIRSAAVDLRAPSRADYESTSSIDHERKASAPIVADHTQASQGASAHAESLSASCMARILWGVLFVVVLVLTIYLVRAYFASVFTYEREYEVVIKGENGAQVVNGGVSEPIE